MPVTLEERSRIVLAFARVLFVNGQSTDQILAASERLSDILGLRAELLARWGELHLQAEDGGASLVHATEAAPTGVDMARVASAMRALDEITAGRLAPTAALESIGAISRAPPVPTWLFALAAGAGAAALAMIYGLRHLVAAALIVVSASAGALLRRRVARYSANVFLQPFCAALLAGVIGALAVRYQLSGSLRLVALCPCMILVPGPHLLNGALDLVEARVHLGATRMIYASLVLLAITVGLLLGLALLGVSLPVGPAGLVVPLWEDMIAAGVAVAAFSVFFSTPRHMLAWPVAVGMLAHALRWLAVTALGSNAAVGALIGGLTVGLIIAPVSRRRQMPFAAIGFASAVSMLPSAYLFRTVSGLVQIAAGSNTTVVLIGATIAGGTMAVVITLAMSVGLIAPKLAFDRLITRA